MTTQRELYYSSKSLFFDFRSANLAKAQFARQLERVSWTNFKDETAQPMRDISAEMEGSETSSQSEPRLRLFGDDRMGCQVRSQTMVQRFYVRTSVHGGRCR